MIDRYRFIPKSYMWLIAIILGIMILTGCSKDTATFNPKKDTYIRPAVEIEYDLGIPNSINMCESLDVPTYITKVDDLFFIVDCYHNQVIYNDNLEDNLSNWKIMTDEINRGHTICSDGTIYLIDDTDNNSILIMEKFEDSNGEIQFKCTQKFDDIGIRPHYVVYDDASKTFYALSSMTGELFLFKREKNTNNAYLTQVIKISELDGFYVRSFAIIEDKIYFVSGNATIIEVDLTTLSISNRYPVPNELNGMIQLTKIQDYFYITISTDIYGSQDAATIIRCSDLNDLQNGNYEDVYANFIGGGTPYYISNIDDSFYMCEHRIPGHSIFKFDVIDNNILNVETIY